MARESSTMSARTAFSVGAPRPVLSRTAGYHWFWSQKRTDSVRFADKNER
jgi:hypothetical protein